MKRVRGGMGRFTRLAAVAGALLISSSAMAQDINMRLSENIRCGKSNISAAERISACQILDTTGNLRTTFPIHLHRLTLIYIANGQYPEAILSASEELKIQQLPVFYGLRAEAEALSGDYKTALEDTDIAFAIDHGGAVSLLGRCLMRAVSGRELDLALADCNKAAVLSPQDATIIATRGLVQLRRGEYASAISDSGVAIALTERFPMPLYVRGIAKLKSGDAVGGEADIEAAKVLEPMVAEEFSRYGVKP